MQEYVIYNNNKKKFQIKMVGTGSTNCQIQSSSTLYESPVQGLSRHSVARGFSLQKERYTLIDSIGVRRSSESPGRKG